MDKSVGINIFCWSFFKTVHYSMCANFWGWLCENDDGYTFMFFTHFLMRIGMGSIIFLRVCLQTCYIFLLIHSLQGEQMGTWEFENGDGSLEILFIIEQNFILHWLLGEIIIFLVVCCTTIFFFCGNSWLQYVILYIIKFLIRLDCLINRKHFWVNPLQKLVIKQFQKNCCI